MKVTIYTKSNCPHCVTAKNLLKARNMEYEEVSIDDEARRANFMAAFPEARQMPQIFFGDQRVGGVTGLHAALKKLDENNEST